MNDNNTQEIQESVPSSQVRQQLVDALRLDLVGPWAGHELSEEKLPGWKRPSNWYLTGFLIPSGTPPEASCDADEDDEMDEVPEASGLPEESSSERRAAKKGFFPSSMGLSFLVFAQTQELKITVSWGDYTQQVTEDDGGKTIPVWQRQAREKLLSIPLPTGEHARNHDVPNSNGLQLHVVAREVVADSFHGQMPNGTRSVSVFLINHRKPIEDDRDRVIAFQPQLEVRCDKSFVPRPDPRGSSALEWDDKISDLHFADSPSYATGHAVSADWELTDGVCRVLRTEWVPGAEVEKTETVDIDSVELSMNVLGTLADGDALHTALNSLVLQYREWIEAEKQKADRLPPKRKETALELLRLAGVAATRIERGFSALADDSDALDAFKVANRAVSAALKTRLKIDDPQWRPFQLAFILLNLPELVDPKGVHRETVDLLFFPTGGGKTEAYLGLAAFTMVLRRLRHTGDEGLAGAGVSVIMRYTLRLLTLDQLGRAAGLVCALELERDKAPDRYGTWPFEIGLWVGKAATPNILGRKGDSRSDSARAKVRQFKNNPRGKPSPIPLENCPWCGERFAPDSFTLLPDDDKPQELKLVCTNFECDFSRDRALPIVAVDGPIYRRLPAFLIATVDKFASLPWVGTSGTLLGGADRRDTSGFYGPAEPGHGKHLSAPLPAPDLVIQDELHLIAGPLGTMAGLYETAIEALCLRGAEEATVRPKIVASTATVRRAQDQIQALFARGQTQIFPPQGISRRDSFFARVVPSTKVPARLYLGISAQGRNPKVMMRKAWLAVMGAAEKAYRDNGGHKNEENPADPYMTVLGYFNSLRELGGARRILEEEVQNTVKAYGLRKRTGEKRGLFQSRKTFSEVLELTSRVPTDKVAEARRRLEAAFHENQRVDFAIATNMISVGLDISRLGLMTVFGQPKTNAEYIQATSRVGRDSSRPGLVLAFLNVHKPRDRSHYESFRHYHETFYRSVEVGSVTPFSARALDRGFAGAMVSLARHVEPDLTPARGVERLSEVRTVLEQRLLDAFLERVRHQPIVDKAERDERLQSVQNRVVDLLDSWLAVLSDYKKEGVPVQYQKYEERQVRPLLREMLDEDFESDHHRKFRANRSLRDVEPEVNLFLMDLHRMQAKEQV